MIPVVGLGCVSSLAGSQLQASLAAGTATGETYPAGHHPLSCPDPTLALHPDGTLVCGHAHTGPTDTRTQLAIDQSIAYLLIEEATRL